MFVSHDTEFVEQLQPTKVLLMPDGEVDYFNQDWLELVALAARPSTTEPPSGPERRDCPPTSWPVRSHSYRPRMRIGLFRRSTRPVPSTTWSSEARHGGARRLRHVLGVADLRPRRAHRAGGRRPRGAAHRARHGGACRPTRATR